MNDTLNRNLNKSIRQFFFFRYLVREYIRQNRIKLFAIFTILFNVLAYVWQVSQQGVK